MGCSTFSEYTVVADISCAKVSPSAPLDASWKKIALVKRSKCGNPSSFELGILEALIESFTTRNLIWMNLDTVSLEPVYLKVSSTWNLSV